MLKDPDLRVLVLLHLWPRTPAIWPCMLTTMHLGSQCRERAYRLTCRFCSIMKYLELHWAWTQTQSHLMKLTSDVLLCHTEPCMAEAALTKMCISPCLCSPVLPGLHVKLGRGFFNQWLLSDWNYWLHMYETTSVKVFSSMSFPVLYKIIVFPTVSGWQMLKKRDNYFRFSESSSGLVTPSKKLQVNDVVSSMAYPFPFLTTMLSLS